MTRPALCAVILLAFALRVAGLDGQELRGDETFGYFFSLASPSEIVRRTLELGEPHPVASYWLQHGWMAVAGDSEFALRFPSAGWGILAVALLPALVRRLRLGDATALGAATLAACSPYLIWHAQDARMYSMSLALTMASTLLWLVWRARPALQWAAAYVAVTWLALHTHYYGVYVVVAHGAMGLLPTVRRERGLRGAILPGVAGLLFVPWVWRARHVLAGYHGNGDSPGAGEALLRAANALVMGETTPPAWRIGVALLAGTAIGVGLWQLYARQREAAQVLLLYAAVPLVAIWAGSLTRPVFDERYLVAAAPPLYGLAAAAGGMGKTTGRRMGLALVGLLLAAMITGTVRYAVDPAYSKTRGWRELAGRLELLASGATPATVRLMQNYPDPTLWYYYRGPVAHGVLPPRGNDRPAAQAEVEMLREAGVTRVLFVAQPSPQWDAQGIGHAALCQAFVPLDLGRLYGWELWAYLYPSVVPFATPVLFEPELRLTGAGLSADRVLPGGLLVVSLQWERGPSTPDGLAVSVQMLDGRGGLAAQQDRPLPAAGDPADVYGILVPSDLGHGDYRLVMVVYPAEDGTAPRVRTVDGREVVEIGTVQVVAPVKR